MTLPEFREALFLLRTLGLEDVEDFMAPGEFRVFYQRPSMYFEMADYDTQYALWEVIEARLRHATRKLSVVGR